jgi:hypothetical protein
MRPADGVSLRDLGALRELLFVLRAFLIRRVEFDSSSVVSDAVDESESPAPAGPESFFNAAAAISAPRPVPGGGDASRMGCVWWKH